MTAHRHHWSGADFFVADGRPMMRQACACGTTREIRAFDVTWTPPIRDGEGAQAASGGGGLSASDSRLAPSRS